MTKSKYILVTGGAGYIGSHTCVELVSQGYIPVILDDFSNSHRSTVGLIESITGKQLLVQEGNCTDRSLLEVLFRTYSFGGVVHFAAFKAVGESVAKPIDYYRNNLDGLLTLLSVMEEFEVNKLVFSSSCTVYGTPDSTTRVDENTPLGTPNSPYGWTKWMGEQIIRDAVIARPELNAVLLRYFNPVGAHESGIIGEFPQGIPNNILPYITQTASGVLQQLTVFGSDYPTPDGTCIRDFIHVSDLAEAHIKALEYMENHPELAIFNIGTGKGTSVLELIAAFEKATGNKLNWKFGPRRAGDVTEIYADPSLAASKMNWKSKRTVEQAVQDAWKWEQNRIANEDN